MKGLVWFVCLIIQVVCNMNVLWCVNESLLINLNVEVCKNYIEVEDIFVNLSERVYASSIPTSEWNTIFL